MVLYHQNTLYHGKEALQFITRANDQRPTLKRLGKALFTSDKSASLFYKIFRGTRHLLLKIMGVKQIDNLKSNMEPIFKPIFMEHWDLLPSSLKKHYQNRPFCNDITTVRGHLNIDHHPALRFLKPLFRLLGSVPIEKAKDIPVTVNFKSSTNNRALAFHRLFQFGPEKTYHFSSRMRQVKDREVIEIMKFGLCWRMHYSFQNGKVILKHRGFALNVFNFYLPLPITYLVGRINAEEQSTGDDSFKMNLQVTHPLLGDIYSYSGHFDFSK